MSQYKTGTVSVTNGSAVVTGVGTSWLANVNVGDGFVVVGVPVPYTVAAISNNGQLSLSAPWAGTTVSGAQYAIFRDFTTLLGLPELSQGDIETATIWTRALRLLDQAPTDSVAGHVAEANPHTQYLLETKYEQDRLRESLLKEATLSLDFANNVYEVYEGPVNGMTAKPFNDVVAFTRASGASARNATGGITNVLANEKRLVGNREGLLMEEQRTNLLLWSEDFTQSQWLGTFSLADTGDQSIVSGVTWKEIETNTSFLRQLISITSSTNSYAFTAYLKKATSDKVSMRVALTGGSVVFAASVYDFTTKTLSNPSGPGYTFEVEELSEDVIAFSAVFTDNASGNNTIDFRLFSTDSINPSTGTALFCVAQVEQAAFPSSYIKTEGSQVTRAADICSRTLGAEFNGINDDWTVFCEYRCDPILGINQRLISFNSAGNVTGEFFINASGAGGSPAANFNGQTFTSINLGPSQGIRVAVSKSQSEFIVVANGIHWATDTTFSPASAETQDMLIGGTGGAFNALNGEVKNIQYFPRALSQAELITLTTPEV